MTTEAMEKVEENLVSAQTEIERNQEDKSEGNNDAGGEPRFVSKKIFVGGLPHGITTEEFKRFFESFGTVTDAVVMYNKLNNRARGFGFITFDSEEAVENVLQNNFYELNNKRVEVKRATPRRRNHKRPKNNFPTTVNAYIVGHHDPRRLNYWQHPWYTYNYPYSYYDPWGTTLFILLRP